MTYEGFLQWAKSEGWKYKPEEILNTEDVNAQHDSLIELGRKKAKPNKKFYESGISQFLEQMFEANRVENTDKYEAQLQKQLEQARSAETTQTILNRLENIKTNEKIETPTHQEIQDEIISLKQAISREQQDTFQTTISQAKEAGPTQRISILRTLQPTTQQEKMLIGRQISIAQTTLVRQYFEENPESTLTVTQTKQLLNI